MKVRELKEILKHISDDAEVYIDKIDVSYYGEWEGANRKVFHAARKYVHPRSLLTARRPCKETQDAKESLVIYVEQEKE